MSDRYGLSQFEAQWQLGRYKSAASEKVYIKRGRRREPDESAAQSQCPQHTQSGVSDPDSPKKLSAERPSAPGLSD
jgi:hypothetical protein